MLHRAGGVPSQSIDPVRPHARRLGFVLLLPPKSLAQTWDVIAQRRYADDVAAMDGLLEPPLTRHAHEIELVFLQELFSHFPNCCRSLVASFLLAALQTYSSAPALK
jgi:hypothetical protein